MEVMHRGRSNSHGFSPALAINPSPSHRALRRAGRPRQSATENHRLRIVVYLSRLSIERQATGICQCIENDNERVEGDEKSMHRLTFDRQPPSLSLSLTLSLSLSPNSPSPRCLPNLAGKWDWIPNMGTGRQNLTHQSHTIHPKWTASPPRTFQGLTRSLAPWSVLKRALCSVSVQKPAQAPA